MCVCGVHTVIGFFRAKNFRAKNFRVKIFSSTSNWTKIFLQVACKLMMDTEMEMPCCVRGYHVYKEVREAAIGEVFECHRGPINASFDMVDINIRSKNFHCIIIFMQKIFVRFQRAKIFLRRKKCKVRYMFYTIAYIS